MHVRRPTVKHAEPARIGLHGGRLTLNGRWPRLIMQRQGAHESWSPGDEPSAQGGPQEFPLKGLLLRSQTGPCRRLFCTTSSSTASQLSQAPVKRACCVRVSPRYGYQSLFMDLHVEVINLLPVSKRDGLGNRSSGSLLPAFSGTHVALLGSDQVAHCPALQA